MYLSLSLLQATLVLPHLICAAPHVNNHAHLHALNHVLKRDATTVAVTEVGYTTVDVTATIYVDEAGHTLSVSPPEGAPDVVRPTPTPSPSPPPKAPTSPAPLIAAVPDPTTLSTTTISTTLPSPQPPPPSSAAKVVPPPPPPSSTTTPPPPPPPPTPTPAQAPPPAAPVVPQPAAPASPPASAGGGGGGGSGSFSGDLTWYNPALGSCGITNSDSDPVVAIARGYMEQHESGNPNANTLCGKTITVYYGGKSATAKIVDKCQACQGMDIDVSPSVFSALTGQGAGRVKATWSFA